MSSVGTETLHISSSPDSESYWGSYFKYRKRCLLALLILGAGAAAGCRCQMWLCALWSLGAGAAARCGPVRFGACVLVPLHGAAARCGRVRFGAWVLVPLQGAAARCGRVRFGAWVLVPLLELGCWCHCRVHPQGAAATCLWPCAHWSPRAGRCCTVLPTKVFCYLGCVLA